MCVFSIEFPIMAKNPVGIGVFYWITIIYAEITQFVRS